MSRAKRRTPACVRPDSQSARPTPARARSPEARLASRGSTLHDQPPTAGRLLIALAVWRPVGRRPHAAALVRPSGHALLSEPGPDRRGTLVVAQSR